MLNNAGYHYKKTRNLQWIKVFGGVLMDFLRPFDCLNRIQKQNVYDFSIPTSNLVHDSLLNWKQRTRLHDKYGE